MIKKNHCNTISCLPLGRAITPLAPFSAGPSTIGLPVGWVVKGSAEVPQGWCSDTARGRSGGGLEAFSGWQAFDLAFVS